MNIRCLCRAGIIGYLLISCALGYTSLGSLHAGNFSIVAKNSANTNTGNHRFTLGPEDFINAQGYSRPLTGTFIKDSSRFGNCELTIKNDGNDLDAVAVLTYPNKAVYSAVYIRSGDSFTITGISDSTYDLYFTLGREWNSGSGKFTLDNSFFKFGGTLPFKTTVEGDYQYSSTYTVTLYAVLNGNAGTDTVSENEFPNLS